MLISYSDIAKLGIDYTPQYLRVKVRRGEFPKPVKGGRARNEGPFQWRDSDVRKWMESK